MKVVVAGGTGQLGSVLCRALRSSGHEVVVLSRRSANAAWRTATWDAQTLGPWTAELDGADALVNLVGRSVNCRYTPENRRQIRESRVQSVRVLGEALRAVRRPPRVWLQSSTATLYGHRYDAPNDETHGIIGGNAPGAPDTWRFSTEVCLAWERAALEAKHPSTRQVLLRTAFTLSPDANGVFDVLLSLVRRGLGGSMGDGRQWVSWIHDRDFIAACLWLIENESLEGPVNLAAPTPVTNAEFMRELRSAWGTRFSVPLTRAAWVLELGAVLLQTETELILKSRRVVPERLLASGYRFHFPEWRAAAQDLVSRWRANRGR